MKTIDYSVIIPYKVCDIVSLIMQNKNLNFIGSLEYLYKTHLYLYLSDEKSKLWHLSFTKLYDLLEDEKQNNQFQFPDFV